MTLSTPQIVSVLKDVSIFSALPEPLLEEIASLVEEVAVAAGQTVMTEGEPAHGLFFVARGRVHLDKLGRSIR